MQLKTNRQLFTKLTKQLSEEELFFLRDRVTAIASVVVENEESVRNQMEAEGNGNVSESYVKCMKKALQILGNANK